jgi:hypothetical protein
MLGLAIDLHLFWREFHHDNVITLRNVAILDRFDDYTLKMAVLNPKTNKTEPFWVTFCPDYHPTNELQPGLTLITLQYVEDQRLNCFEIAPDNLGYTYDERIAHAISQRTSNSKQTTP